MLTCLLSCAHVNAIVAFPFKLEAGLFVFVSSLFNSSLSIVQFVSSPCNELACGGLACVSQREGSCLLTGLSRGTSVRPRAFGPPQSALRA
eukprot:COSAG01_NODE_7325_length_3250_cov_128.583624_1_plen_90_part_10